MSNIMTMLASPGGVATCVHTIRMDRNGDAFIGEICRRIQNGRQEEGGDLVELEQYYSNMLAIDCVK